MKHLRVLSLVLSILCVAVVTHVALATVPIVLSHQGRLLDASDHAITGTYTLTYSIYDVASGGSPLWTEDHVGVQVVDGTFSVQLGSSVPLNPDVLSGGGGSGGSAVVRYLQIQVAGQAPITPRTQLLASPYAVASSRVSGDVETTPGSVSGNDGSHDRWKLISSGSVTYVGTWDASNKNSAKLYSDIDSAGLAVRIDDHYLLGLRVSTGINEPLPYSVLHLSDVSGKGLSTLACWADSVVERHDVMVSGFNKAELIEAIASGGSLKKQSFVVNPSTVHSVAEDCNDAEARVGLQVNTTGGWSGGASMSSTRGVSSDLDCTVDANGNGHSERNMRTRINELESRLSLASDIDDDGSTDLEIKAETGTDEALISFSANDATQKKSEANIAALLNGGVVIGCAKHTDGSGIADNSCDMTADDSTSAITARGFQGKYYIQGATHKLSGGSSSLVVASDLDGDGHAERSIWQKVDNSEALSSATVDSDNDGTPDVGTEISAKIPRNILKSFFQRGDKPTSSQFRVVTDSSGASSTVEVDLNHDDNPEGGSKMDAIETRATLKTYFETGDVPTQDNVVQTDCDPNGSSVSLRKPTALLTWGTGMAFRVDNIGQSITMDQDSIPTFSATSNSSSTELRLNKAIADGDTKLRLSAGSSDCAIQVGDANSSGYAELTTSSGTSPLVPQSASLRLGRPAINTAIITADVSSASMTASHASSGPGDKPTSAQFGSLIDSYVHLEDDGITRCSMESSTGLQLRDQFGNLRTSISTEGHGYFADKVGIGVTNPTHSLEVAGGAYCDGTNWVNASDENSKEHFEPVDGAKLLDKISQLEITKWNYKGDSEREHIGPTAQDFKETFGVGSDGKSISTIDPSGIALAAIKELNKQNHELADQNRELKEANARLKKQMDDLARKVEKLASGK